MNGARTSLLACFAPEIKDPSEGSEPDSRTSRAARASRRIWTRRWYSRLVPPDPAGLFSEGGEVMELHTKGSLMIPKPGIERV